MPMDRAAKSAWQRSRRAELARAAGREPGRTGRPATGRTRPTGRGDVAGQRARARARLRGENGWLETHPLLELARAIATRVVRPDRGAVIYQPLHEDAVGAAALALVAGEDAEAAAIAEVRRERGWWARTVQLEGAPGQDPCVVLGGRPERPPPLGPRPPERELAGPRG